MIINVKTYNINIVVIMTVVIVIRAIEYQTVFITRTLLIGFCKAISIPSMQFIVENAMHMFKSILIANKEL